MGFWILILLLLLLLLRLLLTTFFFGREGTWREGGRCMLCPVYDPEYSKQFYCCEYDVMCV